MVAPARSGVASGGELDIPMLLACGSGIYTGLSALLFPLSVMKTRLQARNQPSGVLQEARTIYASAGLGGFFRGLGPVLLGAVPARAAYIAMLEGSKPLSFRAAEALGATGAAAAALCSGVAGFSAVLASQLIYVPVDVVTQRLMVSSDVTLSARQVIRSIVDTSGVAGLYRGFGISMVAYLPGGSVWWGAYGASQAAAEAFSEEIPVVVRRAQSEHACATNHTHLSAPPITHLSAPPSTPLCATIHTFLPSRAHRSLFCPLSCPLVC